MKKLVAAGMIALLCAFGGSADALQPALGNQSAQVVEAQAARNNVNAKYPVWKGGTILAHAKVNSAIEAEIGRFYTHLPKPDTDEFGPTEGYVNWQAGANGKGVLSFVLTESTMLPRAAHPSHYVVGMNFMDDGSKIPYEAIQYAIPKRTPEEIQAEITRQAEAAGIQLFEDEVKKIQSWPRNFYIGEDYGVYFIFQTYEIAPYSEGWIAIKGGELKK